MVGRISPDAVAFVVDPSDPNIRLVREAVAPGVLATWSNRFADYITGAQLRTYHQPLDACANGYQRRGWWTEHARLTHTVKPRTYTPSAITDDEIPF
jgi:hypothetical protein